MINLLKCYLSAIVGATAFLSFGNTTYTILPALGTVALIVGLCWKDIKKDLAL